jgi:hypothetical protein
VVRVAALGAVVAAVVAVAPGYARSDAAALRVVDESPLTVRGLGFKARERVTVTETSAAAIQRRTVTATATGSFVVRFTAVTADACRGFSVRASGNRGTRALVKRFDAICPPPILP